MNSRYSSKEWKMLERIQNANPEVDILTITAMMDNDHFKQYFEEKRRQYLEAESKRLSNIIREEGF
jgi:tRNA A37 threonylcarbamoyladenosine dehydratase